LRWSSTHSDDAVMAATFKEVTPAVKMLWLGPMPVTPHVPHTMTSSTDRPSQADSCLRSSNGDIKTKRNYASIIGVYSVSKRNEPTYSRTWKDEAKRTQILIFFAG
jgi:hypothetical protein